MADKYDRTRTPVKRGKVCRRKEKPAPNVKEKRKPEVIEGEVLPPKKSTRGRPLGYVHQDDVRRKIQVSKIIGRLTDHVNGEVEMQATQVRAAEILLNKALPNLQAVQVSEETEDSPAKITFTWLTGATDASGA